MPRIGMWNIVSGVPTRIESSTPDLEKNLEDWIENDPSLLQSDLTIVGRQLHTPAGPLDLIAIDAQGRWTIIEIKRGKVRRDTIAQALDYAACIATMEWSELNAKAEEYLRSRAADQLEDSLRLLSLQSASETRDLAIIVAGTGRDQGLERIVNFLAQSGVVPITVATFEVFEPQSEQRVLVRELTESDEKATRPSRSTVSVEDILRRAMEVQTGKEFKKIYDAAVDLGLYPRPWRNCIMYTHPSRKDRTLFTVWIQSWKSTHDQLVVVPDAFAEFFDIDSAGAVKQLGVSEWMTLDSERVDRFLSGLEIVVGASLDETTGG